MEKISTYRELFESIQAKHLKENAIRTYKVTGIKWMKPFWYHGDADEAGFILNHTPRSNKLPTDTEVEINLPDLKGHSTSQIERKISELILDALGREFKTIPIGWDHHEIVE
jgi:hypothetical protein